MLCRGNGAWWYTRGGKGIGFSSKQRCIPRVACKEFRDSVKRIEPAAQSVAFLLHFTGPCLKYQWEFWAYMFWDLNAKTWISRRKSCAFHRTSFIHVKLPLKQVTGCRAVIGTGHARGFCGVMSRCIVIVWSFWRQSSSKPPWSALFANTNSIALTCWLGSVCREATLSLAPFLPKCGGFSSREANSGRQRKRGFD